MMQGRGSLGTAAWGRLILEPYQLVPLKRIEQLPEPRLLIADDMGLGKTSEAGLILSRLTQKRRAGRILVVTRARPEPERWRDEMQEKFGLDFQVLNDGADYRRLQQQVPSHLNLYAALPRLIASMHFLAQADRLPDLDRPGIRWDVVVVDEAHHLALRGSSEKRLYELAQVLARRSDALLLLTATPHDGKVESFASLVEMVDEYAVPDRGELRARLVRPLIVRRLKSQVVRAGRCCLSPTLEAELGSQLGPPAPSGPSSTRPTRLRSSQKDRGEDLDDLNSSPPRACDGHPVTSHQQGSFPTVTTRSW